MKQLAFLIVIILSFCNNGLSQDYTGYTHCAEQDSLALVAFYYATGGPDWTSNVATDFSTAYLSDDVLTYYTTDYPNAGLGKWLNGPVKDWFGVTLEKQQIGNTSDSSWRVIHLHPTLSRRSAGDNNLFGYVPKEVGLLTALKWFKVNGNEGLSGTGLPDETYHPTLEELDVEAVYFSGIVSSAIRQCTRLGFTNLRDNNFDSIPIFDFYDEDVFTENYTNSGNVRMFFYRNQIPWSTLELTVDYMAENGGVFEARDQQNVGRAKEIVVAPGSSITLECTEAGSQGTLYWNKDGTDLWEWTNPVQTFENVSASDTGYYKCAVSNEYIKLNDANSDYSKTYTKLIHLTFVPSVPVKNSAYTSYDGNSVYLRFSKPMAVPSSSQVNEFSVKKNGMDITSVGINRTGRLNDILILELGGTLFTDDTITISYTKGTIADVNGGELNSFTDDTVTNYVRETPTLVGAATRKDGEGIELEFDHYINPATFNPDDFTITAKKSYQVEEIILDDGEIDETISKKITLALDTAVYITDTISVSYNKGSLAALYGTCVQSFSDYPVENAVDTNRVNLNIRVIDGSSSLDQVVIKGEMKIRPFNLFDDGTFGDETSGDNSWTRNMQLIEGTYQWEVYNRTTISTYDTVKTVDSETGIVTITIAPVITYNDSLISGNNLLSLTTDFNNHTVTGDTLFKYRTNSVVFILDMREYLAENDEQSIEPYVMGINGDWLNGIPMEERDAINPDSTYIAVASGYNIGDVIQFNFRNGDIWENSTSKARTDTISKNDTVYAVFNPGVTAIGTEVGKVSNSLIVYPNPVDKSSLSVYLQGNEPPKEVSIFNLYGQQILYTDNPLRQIDISSVPAGIYIVSATDKNGKIYRSQIIRK